MKKFKKAFTLIELLITIAVIAILATAGIVSYNSFISKARMSNDNSVISELNNYVKDYKTVEDIDDFNTPSEVRDVLVEEGFDISRLSAYTKDYSYAFNNKTDEFLLVDFSKEEAKLAKGYESSESDKEYIFVFVETEEQFGKLNSKFSSYLQKKFKLSSSELETSMSLDCGDAEISAVKYTNEGTGKTSVIRTNGGKLTIDAEHDTVYHYGKAGQVQVEKIDSNSYHEVGEVASLNVLSGHVVVETGAVVDFYNASESVTCTVQGTVETSTVSGVGSKQVSKTVYTGGEITTDGYYVLINDITLDSPIQISYDVVLDLNGHSISYKTAATAKDANGIVFVRRGGRLTINDATDEGKIDAGTSYSGIVLTKKGETEEGEKASVTINGGEIAGDYYGITGNGKRHNTEIIINGGYIHGNHHENNFGIYHPQVGYLEINGGLIEGYNGGVELRSGQCVVNGGTIKCHSDTFSFNPNGSGSTSTGVALAIAQHTTTNAIKVEINGGRFVGLYALAMDDVQENNTDDVIVVIRDGIFEGKVKNEADPDWVLVFSK